MNEKMAMMPSTGDLANIPVLGICGWSGAGKTTLIESLMRRQSELGRKICVIKHDTHHLQVDIPGKDSDRFFRAGADVLVQNQDEFFFRGHPGDHWSLSQTIRRLAPRYDGFLVEGHKQSLLPQKIWLLHPEKKDVPDVAHGFDRILARNDNPVETASALFDELLSMSWRQSDVCGAVLIGGESKRYGEAKHMVKTDGLTWVERIVDAMASHVSTIVLVGSGEVPPSLAKLPRLSDVPGAAGPIAGIRSAFRWNPYNSWIVTPCDVPQLNREAIAWLLSQRAIGRDAVLPVLEENGPVQPLPAYYDFRCGPIVEEVDSPRRIASTTRAGSPLIPPHLRESWHNVNSPASD